jgi:hypothetical protein
MHVAFIADGSNECLDMIMKEWSSLLGSSNIVEELIASRASDNSATKTVIVIWGLSVA